MTRSFPFEQFQRDSRRRPRLSCCQGGRKPTKREEQKRRDRGARAVTCIASLLLSYVILLLFPGLVLSYNSQRRSPRGLIAVGRPRPLSLLFRRLINSIAISLSDLVLLPIIVKARQGPRRLYPPRPRSSIGRISLSLFVPLINPFYSINSPFPGLCILALKSVSPPPALSNRFESFRRKTLLSLSLPPPSFSRVNNSFIVVEISSLRKIILVQEQHRRKEPFPFMFLRETYLPT